MLDIKLRNCQKDTQATSVGTRVRKVYDTGLFKMGTIQILRTVAALWSRLVICIYTQRPANIKVFF
jgi:hypothetical protein